MLIYMLQSQIYTLVSHSNARLQVCCNNAVYYDACEEHMVKLQSKQSKTKYN